MDWQLFGNFFLRARDVGYAVYESIGGDETRQPAGKIDLATIHQKRRHSCCGDPSSFLPWKGRLPCALFSLSRSPTTDQSINQSIQFNNPTMHYLQKKKRYIYLPFSTSELFKKDTGDVLKKTCTAAYDTPPLFAELGFWFFRAFLGRSAYIFLCFVFLCAFGPRPDNTTERNTVASGREFGFELLVHDRAPVGSSQVAGLVWSGLDSELGRIGAHRGDP